MSVLTKNLQICIKDRKKEKREMRKKSRIGRFVHRLQRGTAGGASARGIAFTAIKPDLCTSDYKINNDNHPTASFCHFLRQHPAMISMCNLCKGKLIKP